MDHVQALVDAYEDLGRRVTQTLTTQNDDADRLRDQLDEVHAFTADAERVRLFFPGESMKYRPSHSVYRPGTCWNKGNMMSYKTLLTIWQSA